MTKRLLIIPARTGSKRIKNKNIRNFFGKPIIYYPLEQALKSKKFNKIHISTESKDIKKVLKKYQKYIDFLRPKNLAKDNTDLMKVIRFVVKKYQDVGKNFDEVWCILPCSPLITEKDINECSKIILKYKKPVVAASPFPVSLNWAFQIKKGFIYKTSEKKMRDKKLSKIKSYYDSGQIYCFPTKFIKNNVFNFNQKICTYKLPIERSVDIDTEDDWKLAKILFKGNYMN